MIGAISGLGFSYGVYPYRAQAQNGQSATQANQVQAAQTEGAQRAGAVFTARRAAQPELPVQPVRSATPVGTDAAKPAILGPFIREGADPVEMAVRMRIRYDSPVAQNAGQADMDDDLGAEAVQAAAKEGECQTCKERKYQDGSDDMGVSFQTPTRVDPDLAASAVRGHEMEHVVREQAKAQREDRKVVSQSVTYHTAICPECGKAYVSGGTTRTTTAANTDQQPASQQGQENPTRVPFSAVA